MKERIDFVMRDIVNSVFSTNDKDDDNVKYTLNHRINDLKDKEFFDGELSVAEQRELHLLSITNDVLFRSISSEIRNEHPDGSLSPDAMRGFIYNRYFGFVKGCPAYSTSISPEENVRRILESALSDDIVYDGATQDDVPFSFLDKDFINNPAYTAEQRKDTVAILCELRDACGFSPDSFFSVSTKLRPLPSPPELQGQDASKSKQSPSY